MSGHAFHDFRTRLLEDEVLQQEMARALGTSVLGDVPAEALASFAVDHGFHLTAGDVRAAQAELGEEELEGVSGGAVFIKIPGTEPVLTEEEKKKKEEEWKKAVEASSTLPKQGGGLIGS